MSQAIAAYLHYLSIFVLFSLLSLEHVLFKLPMDSARARSLIRIDISFGITAGVVLLTGLARVIWFGKGWSYYLHNGVFHAKVGLFVLVGLLSIIPTLTFFEWRNALKAGREPHTGEARARLTIGVIRAELALLMAMPLLATLMARGFGYSG